MAQIATTRIYTKQLLEFIFAADETTQEIAINASNSPSEIVKLVIKTPDFTNAVNSVLSFENSDGNEVFADSARAENATYVIQMDGDELIQMNQTGEKYILTLSGVPGAGGATVEVTLYGKG